MTRVERIGDATLVLGDCREWLASVPACFRVDAVVTSPPYDAMRDYGGHKPVDTLAVIDGLAPLITDGGVMMWNVADQVVNGSESGTSFRQALRAMDAGLRLHDTMIYCKEGVTFPDANRYHPAFEYMFVFSKGAPACFYGIKDWLNKWRGSPIHGTDREPDGSLRPTSRQGEAVLDYGLRRNWWPISNPYTGATDGHPAPMPYRMAADHIQTWTRPGQTVLDPFMGSGTTGIACLKLGRKFIGVEIEEKYFSIACRRIEAATKEPRLELPQPKPKQLTLLDGAA